MKLFKELWNAPNIKGQINMRQVVGAAATTTVVATIIMYIATLLASNASSFGTWGPIVGAAATLIIQILTKLNVGTPIPPIPPLPTPTPTSTKIS